MALTVFRLVSVALLLLEFHAAPAGSCMQTTTVPETTQTFTPTPTTAAASCVVGTMPYGTFTPAPGTTVASRSIVLLTCDTTTHTSTAAVLSSTCSNGVLSPTSDRCFKAFPAGLSVGVCQAALPCNGVGLPYNAPAGLAQTLNIQALIDAASIGIANNVNPGTNIYYVGIGDPNMNGAYQLNDGTPVPSSSIVPLFVAGEPTDTPANTEQLLVLVSSQNMVGFADVGCNTAFGAICQLQLTK